MIDLRTLIATLAGSIAAPGSARAQQAGLPVIGFLGSTTAAAYAPMVAAFRRGLAEIGHVEGKTCTIEFRWADNQFDRLPELAAELVRRRVSVVTAASSASALAAKAATATIPIVFTAGEDPVRLGLVARG